MMNTRLHARVAAYLDTLMAEIRPLPSERHQLDYSYRLTDDAFVLLKHVQASEADVLVSYPAFKAIYIDDPEGWRLYSMDREGQWQLVEEVAYVAELTDLMAVLSQRLEALQAL